MPQRKDFLVVSLLTLIVAFCSIVYELIYSQALTVLYGGTVTRYSITIGLYILSLGFGAFFYNSLKVNNRLTFFWWNELFLSLIGPLGVIGIFLLSSFSLSMSVEWQALAFFICHAPIVVVGVLSGFELPLLVHLLDEKEKDRFSKILGLDYVGSFFGTVVYSLCLYPFLGLVATALWVGFLNFLAMAFFTLWKLPRKPFKKWWSLFLLLFYAGLLFSSHDIQNFVSETYRSHEIKPYFERPGLKVKKVEIETTFQTAYQDVTFYRVTFQNGETNYCMNLDSNIQLCDESVKPFHFGLADVPMAFLKDRPVRALVIGGGDWIGIHHLLQYPNVESIDHVDVDRAFYEYMKSQTFFSAYHGDAYKDPKVRTVSEDGFRYLRFNKKKYDLILIDLPGITHDKLSHIYSVEFYQSVLASLTEEGFAVTWAYAPKAATRKHYKVLMNTFKEAGFRHHIVYDTGDFKQGGLRSTQLFYLLSKNKTLKPHALPPREHLLGVDLKRQSGLTWVDIPYFPRIRSNTVLRPNYDVILK